AQKLMPGKEEDCFVAALLMDIGTLLLDQLLGDAYGEVCERAGSHANLQVAETHALGITHPEVAGLLAAHWKLPEQLGVPMAAHHAPRGVDRIVLRKISEMVWLAGRCADIFAKDKES